MACQFGIPYGGLWSRGSRIEWEDMLAFAVELKKLLHEVSTMRSLCAVALLVLVAESALAADNPWVGIWKPSAERLACAAADSDHSQRALQSANRNTCAFC